MSDYKIIMDRLKLYYGVTTYVKVAERLGINYDTIKSWGSRKKIVLETLLAHMQYEPININWLLTGNGNMKLSEGDILLNDISKIEKALNNDIHSELLDCINKDQDMQKLISLLEYAPKKFIMQVTKRLEEFKNLSSI